jgi:hypothetical protein
MLACFDQRFLHQYSHAYLYRVDNPQWEIRTALRFNSRCFETCHLRQRIMTRDPRRKMPLTLQDCVSALRLSVLNERRAFRLLSCYHTFSVLREQHDGLCVALYESQ